MIKSSQKRTIPYLHEGEIPMRNKLIYCIPLALSITCLIGCAAKAAQMPAEPESVALLPEQKQSSIVTSDARNETIPTPQQSEHEDTPVRIVKAPLRTLRQMQKPRCRKRPLHPPRSPMSQRTFPPRPSTPRPAMWSRSLLQNRNLRPNLQPRQTVRPPSTRPTLTQWHSMALLQTAT